MSSVIYCSGTVCEHELCWKAAKAQTVQMKCIVGPLRDIIISRSIYYLRVTQEVWIGVYKVINIMQLGAAWPITLDDQCNQVKRILFILMILTRPISSSRLRLKDYITRFLHRNLGDTNKPSNFCWDYHTDVTVFHPCASNVGTTVSIRP